MEKFTSHLASELYSAMAKMDNFENITLKLRAACENFLQLHESLSGNVKIDGSQMPVTIQQLDPTGSDN